MYILAIETTGAAASVALIDENGQVTSEENNERLNHLKNLMLMIQKLLEKRSLQIDDISCIAVSEGPGSFTGIRIGVSTARALAQSLDLEIIPVPTLRAFAYNMPDYNGFICPIFDARREQVYSGVYVWDRKGLDLIEKMKGDAYTLEELFEKLEEVFEKLENTTVDQKTEIMFFGDGITIYEEQIVEWAEKNSNDGVKVTFAPENSRFQHASSIARMALELQNDQKSMNYENVKPVYMRKAEAQRKLDEGSLTSY